MAGPTTAPPLPRELHTPLCDLLGIRCPVGQAGMGYVARSAREVVERIVEETDAVLARLRAR